MSTEELLRAANISSVETGGVSNAMVADDPSILRLVASLGTRLLLFWNVFVAAIVIHTSKQTVDDFSQGNSETIKFTQYSAYKYLLSVLWIVFAYTFLAFLNSIICGRRDHCGRRGNKSFLLRLIKYDAMILTLLASATGVAGAVLFIETKGNSHDGRPRTCDVFDKFCRRMWASFGLSVFACFLFIWIIINSARAIRTA